MASRVKEIFKSKLPSRSRSSGPATDAVVSSADSRHDHDALGLTVWCEPQGDHEPLVDIVFVHGLTGKRTKTWLADGAVDPWPKTFFHQDLPGARIIAYGYDADVVNFIKPAGQNTVRDHARNLNYDLTNLRRGTSSLSRPLIYVVHSLGGLVCEQACLLANESPETEHQLIEHLVGIMFMGTPHAGSSLAKFAIALGYFIKLSTTNNPNTSNFDILKRDSEVLAGIQDSFSALVQKRNLSGGQPLRIHCCIEEKPVPGLGQRVVEPDSAHFPGYHTSCTIPADHMGMTRFSHQSDVGYVRVLGKLKEWIEIVNTLEKAPPAKSKHLFLIPFAQDQDFVGRKGNLDEIDVRFAEARTLRRVALTGLGGIGKTQIAIEYAYRAQLKSPGMSIFWLNASNVSRFEQSYRDIAVATKLPGLDDVTFDVLSAVSQWLSIPDNGHFLLILDNADDKEMFFGSGKDMIEDSEKSSSRLLAQYLPQSSNVKVLLTSRDGTTALNLVGNQRRIVLSVDSMVEEEALELLTFKLPETAGDAQARKQLMLELDYIPLAITQAAAYIAQVFDMTIDKYLAELKRGDTTRTQLLTEHMEHLRRYHGSPNSVIRTWQISFRQIREHQRAAADVLALMAMFDHQSVPSPLIRTTEVLASDSTSSPPAQVRNETEAVEADSGDPSGRIALSFGNAISVLIGYSLIKRAKEEDAFSMHALVQLATRSWIRQVKTLETLQRNALVSLWRCRPVSPSFENWRMCDLLAPHVQAVVGMSFTVPSDLDKVVWLCHNTGCYAFQRADWSRAEYMVQKAVDIYSEYLDLDDWSLSSMLEDLAGVFIQQGRPQEAAKIYKGLLARMKPSTDAEKL